MLSTKSFDNNIYAKTIDGSTLYNLIEEDVQSTISATPAGTMSDGTAATPGLEFSLDTDTGIYRVADNHLGITAGGGLRLGVSTTNITSTLPYLAPVGSVSLPAYSFSSDSDTGIYRAGADSLGISLGGSRYFDITTTSTSIYNETFIINNENTSNNTFTYAVGSDSIGGMEYYNFARWTDGNTRVQIGFEHAYEGRPAETANPVSNDGRYSGVYLFKNNQIGEEADGAGKVRVMEFTDQGQVLAGAGSIDNDAASPTYSFLNDVNTGIYSSGSDSISISTAGTDSLIISNASITTDEILQLRYRDGTETNAQLKFARSDGSQNVRLWVDSSNDFHLHNFSTTSNIYIEPSVNGNIQIRPKTTTDTGIEFQVQYGDGASSYVNAFDVQETGATFGVNITMPADSTILNSGNDGLFIDDISSSVGLQTGGFQNLVINDTTSSIQCGTLNLRPLTVLNTTANWNYQVGDGVSGWTDVLALDQTNADFNVQIHTTQGTASAPAIVLNGDTNTGIYHPSADNIGLTAGGTNRLNISTTTITSTEPFQGPDGTVSAPAYGFSSDTDSGVYLPTAGEVSITTGNNKTISFTTSVIQANTYIQLPAYTVAGLTTPIGPQGWVAFCTNTANGAVPVYFDGGDWKYFSNDAVVTT